MPEGSTAGGLDARGCQTRRVIGLGYAATAPLTPAVASDLFGGPHFPRIFGVLHATDSFGGAVGAWTAGYIFDVTGSYALGASCEAAPEARARGVVALR